MVDATARRKWDKDEYARRARERLEAEERELNKDLGELTPTLFRLPSPLFSLHSGSLSG